VNRKIPARSTAGEAERRGRAILHRGISQDRGVERFARAVLVARSTAHEREVQERVRIARVELGRALERTARGLELAHVHERRPEPVVRGCEIRRTIERFFERAHAELRVAVEHQRISELEPARGIGALAGERFAIGADGVGEPVGVALQIAEREQRLRVVLREFGRAPEVALGALGLTERRARDRTLVRRPRSDLGARGCGRG
jgi:hypothetical protein